MKTLQKTLLSTALLAIIATPALAAEGKKTKEIKELVGYNVTERTEYTGKRANAYARMDKNADGNVTFKEYAAISTVDNEYEIFSLIDADRSKGISIDEYMNADVTKGRTHFDSTLHGKNVVKGTNLKTRSIVNKTYYKPVEPTIVEIKDIEPAGN